MNTALHDTAQHDASEVEPLLARGVAFGLLARLFGTDTHLSDGEAVEELAALLDRLEVPTAARRLRDALGRGPLDAGELHRQWIHWFEQGRVSPYECSNTLVGAGGHTPRLADLAGFYRAFGFRVQFERPDHVVAELEFASFLDLAEADARQRGEHADADVYAHACRIFLRDHLGTWLDAWAARIEAVEPPLPWAEVAAAAGAFVRAEAARRNVVPVRVAAVFADVAVELPEEPPLPLCGAEEEDELLPE